LPADRLTTGEFGPLRGTRAVGFTHHAVFPSSHLPTFPLRSLKNAFKKGTYQKYMYKYIFSINLYLPDSPVIPLS
jgi:hypothetical protein